jgi:hypothetical protein
VSSVYAPTSLATSILPPCDRRGYRSRPIDKLRYRHSTAICSDARAGCH